MAEDTGAQFDKTVKAPPPLLRKISSRGGMQRLDEGDGATSTHGSGRILSSISSRFGSNKSLDEYSSSIREEPIDAIELPQIQGCTSSMSIGQVVSSPDLGSPLDAEGSVGVSSDSAGAKDMRKVSLVTLTDDASRTTSGTRGSACSGQKRRKWSVVPLLQRGMSSFGSSGDSVGTDAVQVKEGGANVFWCCARWMCFCTLFFAFTTTAWGLTVAGVLPGWVPRTPPLPPSTPAPLVALGGTYGLAITARIEDPNDLLVLSSSPAKTGWLLRALAKEMAGTARLDSATIVRTETLDIMYNSSALTREDMERAAGDVAIMMCGQHSCLLESTGASGASDSAGASAGVSESAGEVAADDNDVDLGLTGHVEGEGDGVEERRQLQVVSSTSLLSNVSLRVFESGMPSRSTHQIAPLAHEHCNASACAAPLSHTLTRVHVPVTCARGCTRRDGCSYR